jgi:hypothetical protein
MLVYRVEHKRHCCGPYHIEGYACNNDVLILKDDIVEAHSGDNERPVIYFELFGRLDGRIHRCGFSSFSLLRKWFKGWGKRLRETDFVVRVLRVPKNKVLDTGPQLAFEIAHAQLLKEYKVPKSV